MVIWGGCGQLNRFLIATSQRLLSHPGLDELPILLLSSGCKFLGRDTRATTAVVAASLCEAVASPTRRRLQVVQIVMGRHQPLLKLRPGEQRASLQKMNIRPGP